MARRRFFVDQVRKGQAEITGENAHHLTRVLRVEVGQKFEITDNERAWLDEQAGAEPLLNAFAFQTGDSTALSIGPEGGWIDAERDQFRGAGWTAASLGPSILRSETAVCAALSVLAQMWLVADFGKGSV